MGGTRKVNCRAATALRMAAQSLHHSKSALGDFYRRMRAKLGAPKAITAAAHKLARIIFHLVTTRQEFDESHLAANQLRFQKKQEAAGQSACPRIPTDSLGTGSMNGSLGGCGRDLLAWCKGDSQQLCTQAIEPQEFYSVRSVMPRVRL